MSHVKFSQYYIYSQGKKAQKCRLQSLYLLTAGILVMNNETP